MNFVVTKPDRGHERQAQSRGAITAASMSGPPHRLATTTQALKGMHGHERQAQSRGAITAASMNGPLHRLATTTQAPKGISIQCF